MHRGVYFSRKNERDIYFASKNETMRVENG
jgi:hypothetical protein